MMVCKSCNAILFSFWSVLVLRCCYFGTTKSDEVAVVLLQIRNILDYESEIFKVDTNSFAGRVLRICQNDRRDMGQYCFLNSCAALKKCALNARILSSVAHQMKYDGTLCGNIKENYKIDKQNKAYAYAYHSTFTGIYPLSLYLFGWCNTQAMHVHWFSGIFQCIFRFCFYCCYLNVAASFLPPQTYIGSYYMSTRVYLIIYYCMYISPTLLHFSLSLSAVFYTPFILQVYLKVHIYLMWRLSAVSVAFTFLFWNLTQTRSDTATHTCRERERERESFVRTACIYTYACIQPTHL